MENKYYAGGIEISKTEHQAILYGEREKLIRCPDGQPGICLCFISDHINQVGEQLDESDPVLIEVLKAIKLPIEKTYIVHTYKKPCDPLERFLAGFVYGYW
jgi:hypothetical protein